MSKLVLDDELKQDVLQVVQRIDQSRDCEMYLTEKEVKTLTILLKIFRDKAIEDAITNLVGIDL